MRPLKESERLDWLRLIRTPTIGPITFAQLIERYGNARDALEALPELARGSGRATKAKPIPVGEAEKEIARAEAQGARLIASCEPAFPLPLKAIPDPPPLIYVRGNPTMFDKPAVAIVGARNASGAGCKLAGLIAKDLGDAGVVVVSGLARGVDGAAHKASLKTGAIAVVAGGVDVLYPPEHDALTKAIAENGAVISERPMGAEPLSRDFPRRNRLISGLSLGVMVVEAAARSGTLITARYALEQGREVFAAPGSPLDPRCAGANRLIKEGATLVEKAEDILQVLAEQNRAPRSSFRAPGLDDAPADDPDPLLAEGGALDTNEIERADLRQNILDFMSPTPLHRDDIMRAFAASQPGLIADILLDLVLAGEITEDVGGRYSSMF
ncbi:MAG: DNA-processing protein DprA [Pseudomonadota bacterium]